MFGLVLLVIGALLIISKALLIDSLSLGAMIYVGIALIIIGSIYEVVKSQINKPTE